MEQLGSLSWCKSYVTDCNGTIIWGPTGKQYCDGCQSVDWSDAPDFYCVHTYDLIETGDNAYFKVWKADSCLEAEYDDGNIVIHQTDCSQYPSDPRKCHW
jgi:hypothetical protein